MHACVSLAAGNGGSDPCWCEHLLVFMHSVIESICQDEFG